MKNSNHNKQWDDLNPKLVIDGGGELLERMNLPRRGFEVMSFLEAHGNKHKFDFSDVGRRRAYGHRSSYPLLLGCE
jgi:hypothetical protein